MNGARLKFTDIVEMTALCVPAGIVDVMLWRSDLAGLASLAELAAAFAAGVAGVTLATLLLERRTPWEREPRPVDGRANAFGWLAGFAAFAVLIVVELAYGWTEHDALPIVLPCLWVAWVVATVLRRNPPPTQTNSEPTR